MTKYNAHQLSKHADNVANLGRNAEALHLLETHEEFQRNPILLFQAARILADMDRRTKALLYTNRALELKPNEAACLRLRGKLLIASGQYDEGLAQIKESSRLIDHNFAIVLETTCRFFSDLRHFEAANKCAEALLKEEPENPIALAHMIKASMARGSIDARDYIERLLKISPSDSVALAAKGVIAHKNNDLKTARECAHSLLGKRFVPAALQFLKTMANHGLLPRAAYLDEVARHVRSGTISSDNPQFNLRRSLADDVLHPQMP